MKSRTLLLLFTGISLSLLGICVALVQAYPTNYYPYYSYLAYSQHPSLPDCDHSAQFNNIYYLRTILDNSYPSGYTIYIGYSDSIEFGEGDTYVIEVTAPAWGPLSPSGSWYGIWGNGGPNWQHVYIRVKVVWPGPWQ